MAFASAGGQMGRTRFGIWALLALAILSCGRQDDLLFYVKDVPQQLFEGTHKLKEIQGESQVDILWVIDNSGSMGSYQQDLIKNADTFINDFVSKGGLEWKMGIISSTLNNKPFIGFDAATLLTYQTKNNTDRFKAAVRKLGTFGDVSERFFAPITEHLTKFPDFLRRRASLAVILLTDAPEQSRIPAATFLASLKSFKGDLKKVVTYGVFASVDFGCTFTDENWNYAGSPYEEVIKTTKGKVYKLCNNDFGKNLADLGKDLVERVRRPFIPLADRPVVSSVRVIYKGKDLPGGPVDQGGLWVYDFDLNRVVFHTLDFAPSDTEEVTIQYQSADNPQR